MKKLSAAFVSVLMLLAIAGTPVKAQSALNPPAMQSYVGGKFYARRYQYPPVRINSGGGAAGTSYTINLSSGQVRLQDGRTIVPFSAGGQNILGQPSPGAPAIPVYVGEGSTKELVTPTAVSGCYNQAPQSSCAITASFTYAHGQGDVVTSGSGGIQEAINDAAFWGGGIVVVDGASSLDLGGSSTVTTAIKAALGLPNVSIEDDRGNAVTYWNLTPTATTVLATPTTLVSTTVAPCPLTGACGTVAGSASWGSTTYACITYVDIMGQEGPCSASYSFTSTASTAIGFTAPAASAGAVGYKIYLSVSGGSYALAYDIPLLTQAGATAGVCTLTIVETITPACAVTNTSYGQTGSAAVVTGYPVVTSQLAPEAGSASSTTYNPNTNGRTTYGYIAGSHLGIPGVVASYQPFPIATAAQTTVGEVVGTAYLPPGFMNMVGRQLRVCGFGFKTSTVADTITSFSVYWDAEGSNISAGTPVLIGKVQATYATALAAAANYQFCETFVTTVAAATATGGSILPTSGTMVAGQASAGANPSPGILLGVAAVGSLNLNLNARLSILYNHTTGTDGSGVTLNNLTVEVLN